MRLTESHITFVVKNGEQVATFAKDLKLTDKLVSWNGTNLEETEIASIEDVFFEGYMAPLTESGTLLGKISSILLQSFEIDTYTHFL